MAAERHFEGMSVRYISRVLLFDIWNCRAVHSAKSEPVVAQVGQAAEEREVSTSVIRLNVSDARSYWH